MRRPAPGAMGFPMRPTIKRKKITVVPIAPEQHCHTPEQCAEALGVAMSTIWLILKSGKLKSFKAGRSRRITAEAFAAYQAGQ
jgi:excisionase family DNA binding protein